MFFKIARTGVNEWWTWIITFVILIPLGYMLGQVPLFAVLFNNPDLGEEELEAFMDNPDFSLVGIDSNIGFILLILTFVGALLGLWFGIKYLHKRNFLSLITPASKVDWSKTLWSFGLWMILGVLFELIMFGIDPSSYVFQFNPSSFLPLLLISLFLLPIQTSTEELIFRGYALQGIGMLTKSRLAALLVTSVAFGLIHGMNPEVAKYGFWTMQMYYVSAGLILGVMTIMDDSLELALGVHAATNIYGALFLTYEGSALQTDSMFRTTNVNPTLMFLFLIAMGAIFLFLCSRKYQWGSFNKILEKIDEEAPLEDIADHLIENN